MSDETQNTNADKPSISYFKMSAEILPSELVGQEDKVMALMDISIDDRLEAIIGDKKPDDLTTPQGVVALMSSSKSSEEWDRNCTSVKRANNGDYPKFWFFEIMINGVAAKAQAKW